MLMKRIDIKRMIKSERINNILIVDCGLYALKTLIDTFLIFVYLMVFVWYNFSLQFKFRVVCRPNYTLKGNLGKNPAEQ